MKRKWTHLKKTYNMKVLIIAIFEKLLTDPLNEQISKWALGIGSVAFFGNLFIHFLMKNV